MPDPLQTALELAHHGMRVFPANAEGYPLVPMWKRSASSSLPLIRKWWMRWPTASVALVTGRSSRVLVLRVQGELGEAALAKLESEHGPMPNAPTLACFDLQDRLLFFRLDQKLAGRRLVGAGLTVYADGCYLVLPPIEPGQVAS